MAEPSDADLEAALARGEDLKASEPRAAASRYDVATGRVIVELTNGRTFAIPARKAQGLQGARADQLARVEVLGTGYGLHWEDLDADLSVPGLMAGRFGTLAFTVSNAGTGRRPGPHAKAGE